MTRVMYDNVNASEIPPGAQMVGGYVDGLYAWSAADWARFPSAVKVRIAVFPTTDDGEVIDIEQGNGTPADAPGWVHMRRASGADPSVYCSASILPTVRNAFRAAGIPEPHYWAAWWGGPPVLLPGTVAVQYAHATPSDISVVADYWPGVDGADMTPQEMIAALDAEATAQGQTSFGGTVKATLGTVQQLFNIDTAATAALTAVKAEMDGIKTILATAPGSPVDAQLVSALMRIEGALAAAGKSLTGA